jgi:signal transduction histidine kinase
MPPESAYTYGPINRVIGHDARNDRLAAKFAGRSLMIETQFPLGLSKVLADENQLELAILNLCVNTRDAMPDGGAITISTQEKRVGTGHETKIPEGR